MIFKDKYNNRFQVPQAPRTHLATKIMLYLKTADDILPERRTELLNIAIYLMSPALFVGKNEFIDRTLLHHGKKVSSISYEELIRVSHEVDSPIDHQHPYRGFYVRIMR
jgi:hypothetical protein